MGRTFAGLAVLWLIPGSPALAGSVAVTFDDLPIYGANRPLDASTDLTTRLLTGLRRHHMPATGFVNEAQLDRPDRKGRIALLQRWIDAGMDLGNHGYSHLSLSHTPLDLYIADAARGDGVTRGLMAAGGKREHWYRYPFLETGPTIATQRAFESWLKDHGYRVAPVTMENSDWQFADAYDAALDAGDAARAHAIAAAYLDYTAAAIAWYRRASVGLLGREIRFVLLVHASRLNADSIDGLAEILRRAHLRPITLGRALKDPAYRIAETADDPNGDEWLTRWAATLRRALPYESFPKLPETLGVADGG